MQSVEIPSSGISRFLRDATQFLESIDDAMPSPAGSWFEILIPG